MLHSCFSKITKGVANADTLFTKNEKKGVSTMTPAQIRKIVEEFPDLLKKQEKLQKRLISLAGRDLEQEAVVLQRLQSIEQSIEFIDRAIFTEEILTPRESCALDQRTQGVTHENIGKIFSLTAERSRTMLDAAYKKMAKAAK